jgi:hypothetical protein
MELMLVVAVTARRSFGPVRLVEGVLALAAPRLLLGRLVTDPEQDPSGSYPFRLFGVRSVPIGADRLILTGDRAGPESKVAVAIQATDTAKPATRLLTGHLPWRAGSVASLACAVHSLLGQIAAPGRCEEASNA